MVAPKLVGPWRADSDHFTVDALDHTADGFHRHGGGGGDRGVSTGEWQRIQRQKARRERLRKDDEFLMRFIAEWLTR